MNSVDITDDLDTQIKEHIIKTGHPPSVLAITRSELAELFVSYMVVKIDTETEPDYEYNGITLSVVPDEHGQRFAA